MRQLFVFMLLVVILAPSDPRAQPAESKWVAIGVGCLEVPSQYRVVWNEGQVDYFGGFIEPPEHNWQMTWHAGMWQSLLEPTKQRRVLWKRDDRVDGQNVTIGKFEEFGGSFLVVSSGLVEFALSAEIPNAEVLLKAMLKRHSSNCSGRQAVPAERQ